MACGGMAGRAPRFQIQMWSRRARLLSPRSATPHSGASGKRASSGAARGSSCAGPGGQNEGDGPSRAVGDHASLGPVAAMRTAERLTSTPLRRSGAVLVAPAAFWWARIEVPSTNARPRSTPRAWAMASSRSHSPRRDHRMNVCAGRGQCPRPTMARTRRGWRATSPRSRAARESPRPSAADAAAAPSPEDDTPPTAAPAPPIARPSAPALPRSSGA